MSVADHVPLDKLYCSDLLATEVNARLVDGRAVHHYLTFIEPEIVGRDAELEGYRDLLASSDVDVVYHDLKFNKISSLPIFTRIQIYVDGDLDSLVSKEVGALIKKVGLDFFLHLIDVEVNIRMQYPLPALEISRIILRLISWEFGLRWVAAEHFASKTQAPSVSFMGLHIALSMFASSVVAEYDRRLGVVGYFSDQIFSIEPFEMIGFLSDLRQNLLFQELVACWYPCWNRTLFIFDSPFDPMNKLQS